MKKSSLFVSIALIFTVLYSSMATAHPTGPLLKPPEGKWSIGPGFAFIPGDKPGTAVSFDVAYCYFLFAVSATAKMIAKDDMLLFGGSIEVNANLILSVGGGAGYMSDGADNNDFLFHAFVGLPIPLEFLSRDIMRSIKKHFKSAIIEPYYRYNWFGDRRWHEIGLMLKMMTFSI
ncbi:hypothetical protein KKF34_05895 [Myxococcota bacterium]|nr:hypothetical protein [Myxococcota bacterium]MBU1382278.1 hypothetical protein [Myxococcota bacterium]MBU1496393.1 hypothetical protein [Myxococcota bacterium]